jgi:hypothetical protein
MSASSKDFKDALVALGAHLQAHPDLPIISSLSWAYWTKTGFEFALDVHLEGSQTCLIAWAAEISSVSSECRRIGQQVHLYVYGVLAGVQVRVWTVWLGENSFPAEEGYHQWDVFANGGAP